MQTVSQLFKDICSAHYTTQVRVTVDNTVYSMSDIISSSRIVQSMEDVSNLIGNVMSGSARIAIIPKGVIPKSARAAIEVRVSDGTRTSEWIPHGVFFIGQRRRSEFGNGHAIELTCFDSMCKTDSRYATQTLFTEWPQTDSAVAAEIASIIGVDLDARTSLAGYAVPHPGEYTMRETLQYIAVTNCGNWVITPENKLLLIPIVASANAAVFNVGRAVSSYEDLGKSAAYTGIHLYYGDETAFVAGDETGNVLEADCPWGTQTIANAMLAELDGFEHQGFKANGAALPPYAELGDIAAIADVSFSISVMDVEYSAIYRPSIGAPGPDDIESEYPYLSPTQRQLKRAVKVGQEYYGTRITHADGITVERTDGTDKYNAVQLNSDKFLANNSSGSPVLNMDFERQIFEWNGDIVVKDGSITLDKLNQNVTAYITSTTEGIKTEVLSEMEPLVEDVEIQYALGDSQSTAPVSGWSAASPEWTPGKFVWQRTVTTNYTGTTSTSDPVCIQGAEGAAGEDATVLRIDSSRGIVFKNSVFGTVLTVTVHKGATAITDIANLRNVFGITAHLVWSWKREDEGDDVFHPISADDTRISNDGFTLTVTPGDVDEKIVLQCNLEY